MNQLELYIPKLEELGFYQTMMSDPDTMSYNAAWFPPDGCIDFPKSSWEKWYDQWIHQEPDFFFGYLQRIEDRKFVGCVNFHINRKLEHWDMGVVILASERGKGYGKEGLSLLLDRAFIINDIEEIHNEFEKTRHSAYEIHKQCGFRRCDDVDDKYYHLVITKDEYLKNIKPKE